MHVQTSKEDGTASSATEHRDLVRVARLCDSGASGVNSHNSFIRGEVQANCQRKWITKK
jgi:hypothetical protein